MKRFKTIVTAAFVVAIGTGCTFDTDVDADFHGDLGPGGGDAEECADIRTLLDAEDDPDTRSALADALARCERTDEPPDTVGDATGDHEDGDGSRDDDADRDGDPEPGEDESNCDFATYEDADGNEVDGEVCAPNDDDRDPDAVSCQELYAALEDVGFQDVEADSDELDPAWLNELCRAYTDFSDDACRDAASKCFGELGVTDPDGSDDADCELVYQHLRDQNLDPDSLTNDQVYAECVDLGFDPDLCDQVANACFPVGDGCDEDECGMAPGAPNYQCDDGSIGGPVCERTADGECGWVVYDCT